MADDNSIMSFLQGVNSRNNCSDGYGFGGNGFGLLIILFFLIFGGWGNGFAGRNNEMNNQGYESLLAGQNQIKNQMGYDNILSSTRGIEKGICDSTYALNNTVTNGFAGVQNALCQGFSGVNSAVSNLGFNLAEKMNTIAANQNLQLQAIQNTIQSCCCDLKTTMTGNTQKVLDRLCCQENQCLRDKLFEASQREQTATLVATLKPATTTAAAA